VHGRVVDESGLGVEGALVVYGAPPFHDRDAEYHARRGPSDVDPASWEGRTAGLTSHSGPGGNFRVDGVAVGYGVAWARTATSLWAHNGPIGVRAGDDVGGIELVLRDAKDVVISGRVVDPDGRAMAGIDLLFRPSGTDGSEGSEIERTDGAGRFHFLAWQGLAQDITVSWGSAEWNEPNRVGIAPGTHDLVLAFERARWLEVLVKDPEGRPISNGKSLGLPGTGLSVDPLARCEAPLDHAGYARLRRPEKALRVRIEAPGYRDAHFGPFDPSAFPEPLVVMLARVPALVGRVQLPDGRPAAGARVSLETAQLEVHVDPTGLPVAPIRPATYVAERSPVTVLVTFEPSEPGQYGPVVVPAGRGRLDAPTDEFRAPAPVWAELELVPGELRVLDLR